MCVLPEDAPSDTEAQRIEKRLLRQFVHDLQEIEDPLPGEDSVLTIAWDSVCAQRETQESYDWEQAYLPTIETIIFGGLSDLHDSERSLLWLLTEPGQDWEHEKETQDEPPPSLDDDTSEYLFDGLIRLANDYTNHRISAYCDRLYD